MLFLMMKFDSYNQAKTDLISNQMFVNTTMSLLVKKGKSLS